MFLDRAMKFESKVLLSFSLLLLVSLSIINIYIITFYRDQIEDKLRKEVRLLIDLVSHDPRYPLPSYLRISKEPKDIPNFRLHTYTDNYFVYVKDEFVEKNLKRIIFSLLVWEAGVVVSTLMLTNLILRRFYVTEKEREDLLNVLILAITHKVGNFISTLKVDTELALQGNIKAVKRLRLVTEDFEADFKKDIDLIEKVRDTGNLKNEEIYVKELITKLIYENKRLFNKDVKVSLKVKDIRLKTHPFYIETLLNILLENAVKYSKNFVQIKSFEGRSGLCIVIRNDIGEHVEGSGMGLKIADYLAKKMGVGVVKKIYSNNYTIFLKVPSNFTILSH